MSAPVTEREQRSLASLPRSGMPKIFEGALNVYNGAYRRLSTMSVRDVPLVITLVALILTGFGCMMVLSASFVGSISRNADAYSQAISQARSAAVGLVVFGIAAFMPIRAYRNRFVPHLLLLIALAMQVAVVVFGVDINGNRNWIQIGGQSLQPSETSKILIILWLAYILNMRGNISRSIHKALVPSVLGWGALVGLILMGRDMGTVVVYAAIYFGMLWFAGAPGKLMLGTIGAGLLAAIVLVIQSPNRLDRFFAVFGNCTGAVCDQTNAGLAALATGGIWGVGLGQSRQKYNYLPEPHNDYIFAIIGEELGLVGTLSTLILYLVLFYGAIRILLRSYDRFIRLATGGIILWFASQMLINIAMVTGVGPVVGIPLPFVSFGGTSLMASFAAAGCLVAFARQTPLAPLAGERRFADANSLRDPRERKDALRRQKLLPVIVAEQEHIATAKPFDWNKTMSALGLAPAPVASGCSRSHTRPSSTQRPRNSEPLPKKRSGARPSGSIQRQAAARTQHAENETPKPSAKRQTTSATRHPSAAANASRQQVPGAEHSKTSQKARKVSAAPRQKQSQRSSAQEQRIPAGLTPIRRAKKLPPKN
ncbi:FtsW/RodA/SpoVE family cell cycle protein [Rothia sp. ZJ1223]|uniref:FtsW/RodA/SpoVE family cell cycle protein n=1 Tax=Rothia sp. ZJ1223 TaxID=2811098 RepID=UPI00195C3630|nr:putative peptidoglycan glycosyltransferase FtsW [Rothia sp. ZJ1223]MBM7050758.1 FtsW/RodA/SpoVE family cell cycle protein [Rothia sp. ZJ1223]